MTRKYSLIINSKRKVILEEYCDVNIKELKLFIDSSICQGNNLKCESVNH